MGGKRREKKKNRRRTRTNKWTQAKKGGTQEKIIAFFFSSRRRHTRLVSDWSSDVCSSDLHRPRLAVNMEAHRSHAQANATPAPRHRSP